MADDARAPPTAVMTSVAGADLLAEPSSSTSPPRKKLKQDVAGDAETAEETSSAGLGVAGVVARTDDRPTDASDAQPSPRVVRNEGSMRWDTVARNEIEAFKRQFRPPDFLRRSTQDSYQCVDCDFRGPYAHLRAQLDYSYHKNYTYERQELQDVLITAVVDTGTSARFPWLVFTAGCMGCGKTWTMNWLRDQGKFPLDQLVRCDPDRIRVKLPETESYREENPETVGELTQKECGLVCELIEARAEELSKHILRDGSLRDHVWFSGHFNKVRRLYPQYRIAIVHILASREKTFERAAARGLETGRAVPQSVLEAAMIQVPRSVEILSPLADETFHILNDGPTPTLVDGPATRVPLPWDAFIECFRDISEPDPHHH